jgi:hypothetical protein
MERAVETWPKQRSNGRYHGHSLRRWSPLRLSVEATLSGSSFFPKYDQHKLKKEPYQQSFEK